MNDFTLKQIELIKKLDEPTGVIDVVLDTDTYNEIDDQFAIAYLLKNSDKLKTKAIYAAPFYKEYVGDVYIGSTKVGMEKSYEEIIKLLTLMGETDRIADVYKGSETFLENETTPIISDAANDLAKRAMNYSKDNPLYVIAIGAITNVASAILLNPEIIDNIVVVWLGGNASHIRNNREFNCMHDVASARVVFGAGLALVQLPCGGVVSSFTTTKYELEHFLKGKNELCDYLLEHSIAVAESEEKNKAWSRVIWDVTAVAWALNKGFTGSELRPTPMPEYDHYYSYDCTRHIYKYVGYINRDALMTDLFEKLAN